MLEFIQGNNLDYDGARELESVEKSEPLLNVHITFKIKLSIHARVCIM